jgi:hypothetical protein
VQRKELQPNALKPIRAWVYIVLGLLALVAATTAIVALVWVANGSTGDKAATRIDAIRTGLTIGAGTGGLAALALAARRQWLSERAQIHTESDASERRVTEIFNRAVEQLGHEKPQVRLGGLYSLERLGVAVPGQRQAIVNVICGYLRMPYNPPYVPSAFDVVFSGHDRTSAGSPRSIRPDARRQGEESRRELEVRQTAQRILADRLSKDDAYGWRALDGGALKVSLRRAVLVDFDMSSCKIDRADFELARFVGTTHFEGTEFVGQTHFNAAVFEGPCWIRFSRFPDGAWFDGVEFTNFAWFDETKFVDHVRFPKAEFRDYAFFGNALFDGMAWFGEARFHGGLTFENATFVSRPRPLGQLDLEGALIRQGAANDPACVPEGWELSQSGVDGWLAFHAIGAQGRSDS